MKIQKKHARLISDFVFYYVDEEFYPLADSEARLLERAIGFGVHHNTLDIDEEFSVSMDTVGLKGLPPKSKRARLEIYEGDYTTLMSMLTEYHKISECEPHQELKKFLELELNKVSDENKV